MSKPASRILVVEDEPDIRAYIALALEDEGFEVLSAADASEAFEQLTSDVGISLLITDIRIPGSVDGKLFAGVAAEYRPDMPILVISGYGEPSEGELPPHARFIPKPFVAHYLIAQVLSLLNERP